MHELSIAMSILDGVEEEMQKHAGARVEAIHIRLGPLSGVMKESLQSAYELGATEMLHGSDRPFDSAFRAKYGDRYILENQPRVFERSMLARGPTQAFRAGRVFVVSLVSSPGSGKTTFPEKTLTLLKQSGYRPAAVVGDLATDHDAARLARSQAPVKQITTGTLCHLEAAMIESAVEDWDVRALDFLFIENVGNLVCPSAYDLGENMRAVLLSVTEGEDNRRSRAHQDGSCRGCRIRPRCRLGQHPVGSPGNARDGTFGENRHGHAGVDGLPGG